jgi:hypothetical protein
VEPAFHRRIHDASLGRAKEKIPGGKRKNSDRTKRGRQSNAEVSLDNADAVIEGAQQTAATTPQAVQVLLQALRATMGTASISDVTLTGTVRRIAGSDDETGTAVLRALATGEARMDFSFPSGQRGEVRATSNNVPAGTWTGPDGKAHAMSQHNLMTSSAWFQPALTLSWLVSSQNTSVLLVGSETRNGLSVIHLTASQQFPDMPGEIAPLMQHLSQMDIFLDSSTQLPVALAFNQHPDNDAGLDIPAEVRFSDYRAVSGVQVPFHIQRYLNNSLILDIRLQAASLNSGLTASAFAVQ